MVPSVTAAGTSTASAIGLVTAALVTAVGSVAVGGMTSRATVRAARVSAKPHRSNATAIGWVVALGLLCGLLGMVAAARWVGSGGSGGGDGSQAGATPADEGGTGHTSPGGPAPERATAGKDRHAPPAKTPSAGAEGSAESAPCPGREQISRAESQGEFTVVGVPSAGSIVVLQMGVLGNSGEILITICRDPGGAYWYVSHDGDHPHVGVVAPATPVPEGVYADVTFPDRAVRFVVTDTGVGISPTEELPLTRVVCRGQHLPGDLDSLDDVGRCTRDVVDPWDV